MYDERGIKTNYTIQASSSDEAKQKVKTELGSYYSSGGTGSTTIPEQTKKAQEKYPNSKLVYEKGGLVDFTGPAWVDGTPSHPEAFLSAYDTETIRGLIDAFNYVRVNPGFAPGAEYFNGGNQTIGDIIININQAELKDDADYQEVARRVGAEFTKQLAKEGLTLTGYSF